MRIPRLRRRTSRLGVLITIGLIAIAAGLATRSSSWARERRLNSLSVDELALAVHDAPNDSLTWLYYGRALLQAGDLANADGAFQRAAKLDARDDRSWLGSGAVRMQMGDAAGSASAFESALKGNPKNAAALLGLSQAYYQQGYVGKAADCLEKELAIEPKSAANWYRLGRLAAESNQRTKSLDALKKCVQLDPKMAAAWSDLGYLSLFYGQYAEAEQQLAKAVRLGKSDPLARYRLGVLYMRMPDTPQNRGNAEQALLTAIARDPNMADAYSQLGQLYERGNNLTLAIHNLRKACELDPSSEQSLYHLGRCLLLDGKAAEGNRLIKASQEMAAAKTQTNTLRLRIVAQPRSRPLRLRLARLYRQYGNYEGAIMAYRQYLQLGPPDPNVEKEMNACTTALSKAESRPPDAGQGARDPNGL